MVLYFFLIGIPAMLMLLLIIAALAFNGKPERIRLTRTVEKEILLKIENIRTYRREKDGWRNSFPKAAGWERADLLVAKDFILITRKLRLLSLLNSEPEPFIVAPDPEPLKKRLAFSGIYRPSNMRISGYGEDLEFTIKPSSLLGTITIYLTFENIGKRQLEKLFALTDWT